MEGLALAEGFNRETRIFQLSKELGMQLGDTADLACPPPGYKWSQAPPPTPTELLGHKSHHCTAWTPGVQLLESQGHPCLSTAIAGCKVVCLDPPRSPATWPHCCGDPQSSTPLHGHTVLPLPCCGETTVCTELPRWDSRSPLKSQPHSPGSSHHGQGDGQANAQVGPHEGRGLRQEPEEEVPRISTQTDPPPSHGAQPQNRYPPTRSCSPRWVGHCQTVGHQSLSLPASNPGPSPAWTKTFLPNPHCEGEAWAGRGGGKGSDGCTRTLYGASHKGCIYPTSWGVEAPLTVALAALQCRDYCPSLKSTCYSLQALLTLPTSSHSPEDAGIYRELTRPHQSGSPGQILCSRSLESKSDMGTFRQAPATSPALPFPPLPAKPQVRGPRAQHSM